MRLSIAERAQVDASFHLAVQKCCGNKLLEIGAYPVLVILQKYLRRSALPKTFFLEINRQHRRIAAAVRAGEADKAAAEMHDHVEFLRPHYEKVWHRETSAEVEDEQ